MNQLFTKKEEISKWCNDNRIENYTINDDLVVDVVGNVILYLVYMEQLPIQFGHVKGDFILGENGLKTLKGVPHKVGGDFICGGNMINDLDYFPKEIGFRIMLLNNKLESFTSPLESANNIIWISELMPGLSYLEIDDNEYYKYDSESYLQWNYYTKNFFDKKPYTI